MHHIYIYIYFFFLNTYFSVSFSSLFLFLFQKEMFKDFGLLEPSLCYRFTPKSIKKWDISEEPERSGYPRLVVDSFKNQLAEEAVSSNAGLSQLRRFFKRRSQEPLALV